MTSCCTTALHTVTRSDSITFIWHNQTKIPGISWKIGCTSRQWYSKNITRLNSTTPQSIDSHKISNRSRIQPRNPSQSIHRLHNIRHVNCRQRIISPIETSTRQRNKKRLTNIERGRVRNRIGLLNLVRRHEAAVN